MYSIASWLRHDLWDSSWQLSASKLHFVARPRSATSAFIFEFHRLLDCGATVLLSVVGYSFFFFLRGPILKTHGICQWTMKFMKLHPLNQSVHNDSRNSPLACRSLLCQWKQCWPWPFHSLGWHHLLHQGICWANLARDLASCQGLIHLKSSVVNECWVWVFLSLAFWLLQSFFFLLGKKRHAGRS